MVVATACSTIRGSLAADCYSTGSGCATGQEDQEPGTRMRKRRMRTRPTNGGFQYPTPRSLFPSSSVSPGQPLRPDRIRTSSLVIRRAFTIVKRVRRSALNWEKTHRNVQAVRRRSVPSHQLCWKECWILSWPPAYRLALPSPTAQDPDGPKEHAGEASRALPSDPCQLQAVSDVGTTSCRRPSLPSGFEVRTPISVSPIRKPDLLRRPARGMSLLVGTSTRCKLTTVGTTGWSESGRRSRPTTFRELRVFDLGALTLPRSTL